MAQLHLNFLATKPNPLALYTALNQLPSSLDDAYNKITLQIDEQHQKLAFQIFSWLIDAKRPLSIIELQYALAINEEMSKINVKNLKNQTDIISACSGLVMDFQQLSYNLVGNFYKGQYIQMIGFIRK